MRSRLRTTPSATASMQWRRRRGRGPRIGRPSGNEPVPPPAALKW